MPEMSPEATKFTNATFAKIFNEIGAILELKGESPFKVRAYRTAALTFANLHEDVKEVWREGRIDDLPGIGKAITDKVGELMTTGRLRFYERLLEEIPPSLISITEIPHVGPKTAIRKRLMTEAGRGGEGLRRWRTAAASAPAPSRPPPHGSWAERWFRVNAVTGSKPQPLHRWRPGKPPHSLLMAW